VSPRPTHRLQVLICCAACMVAGPIACPSCGSGHLWTLQEAPACLPCPLDDRSCPDCGAHLRVDLLGWAKPPTAAPDRPAQRSPLSDALPGLERAWRLMPNHPQRKLHTPPPPPGPFEPQRRQAQPTPAAAAAAATMADFRRTFPADRTPRPKRPAPPPKPKPKPCPADATRYRLAAWGARDWLPDGVAPSAIAAAYCRVFGMPPRRDPTKRTARSYSLRELALALQDLGLAQAPGLRQGVEL
jgi:hypothetical protein